MCWCVVSGSGFVAWCTPAVRHRSALERHTRCNRDPVNDTNLALGPRSKRPDEPRKREQSTGRRSAHIQK